MLGEVRLADENGGEFDALLRQPKHVALLAYLSLPRPGSWHRRDALLGVFWPDHDQGKARSALRSALYTLRRHLPDGTIRARGDEELGLDPELINSDIAQVEASLEGGRYAEAVDAYAGDLLAGYYVPEAPEFDRWLQSERERIRGLAAKAAAHLTIEHSDAGRLGLAVAAARRASELAPADETAARRWISLLDRSGDRAGAFAVYERLREQLNESLGVRPSSETVALMDAIRTRSESRPLDDDSLAVDVQSTDNVPGRPVPSSPEKVAPIQQGVGDKVSASPAPGPRALRTHSRWMWLALPVIGVLAWLVARGRTSPDPAPTLVVYPMRNETGNATLAYLASGIADGVGRRLDGVGGIVIRSSARATLADTTGPDLTRLGSDLRRTFVLESWLRSRGDTLELRAAVLNAETGRREEATTVSFSLAGLSNAESRVAAAVGATLLRRRVIPKEESDRIDAESYRLTLLGLFFLNTRLRPDTARAHFEAAIARDPRNARAWAGISSFWMSAANGDRLPPDEAVRAGTHAAQQALAQDPRQGSALANLGMAIAIRDLRLEPALALVDSAISVEPSNTEAWLLKSVLLRHAHRFDEARDAIRFAQHLDPFSELYRGREVILHFCAGRPADALSLLETQLEARPRETEALEGARRALAMLGRYDDALDMWRRLAEAEGDTVMQRRLDGVRGKAGYYDLTHTDGRTEMARLQRLPRASTLRMGLAALLAGDSATGFRALRQLEQERSIALHRMSCPPAVDEFRDTPTFKALLQRVGPLR